MKKSLGAKTLAYPAPVWVVGSYDREGKPNVMTAAWCGICCSQPPCLSISLRKATYSYGNIMEKKAFTVNIPNREMARIADYFGLVSGRNVDKLASTCLTPVKSQLVDAPYIKEFPLVIECKLLQANEIGLHTQFIGEIMDVKVEESLLGNEALPDMEMLRPLIFDPGRGLYYGIGTLVGKAFSLGREEQCAAKGSDGG